uniref:Uncharacterized protein n=1 Tax=Erythrolobus australicus TaxID=1077150 RepID=A0A7S1TKH8_9RHOD
MPGGDVRRAEMEVGRREQDAAAMKEEERRRLWTQAIKVPMYTVAVSPMLVGSCAAYSRSGSMDVAMLAELVLAAVGVIAWLNLSNDVFDSDTGIDAHKRESVVNLLGGTRQARNATLAVAMSFLVAAAAALAAITAHDRTPLALLAVSIALGYAYQGPPFRLGYYGLGEPITFATWFASTAAAYHVQLSRGAPSASVRQGLDAVAAATLDPRAMLLYPATLVALLTTLILLASHFHQVHDDARAGKRSPVVRLGTRNAARVVAAGATLVELLVLIGVAQRGLPPAALAAAALVAPTLFSAARFALADHDKPERIRTLKYRFVRAHFLFSVALAAALVFSR